MSINWSTLLGTDARQDYPRIQNTPDRIQIRVDESRYCMAIYNRTYDSWGLYVRVDEQQAVHIDKRGHSRINYIAPAGRPITWMGPTQKGKLSVPLVTGGEPDYWVGCSSVIMQDAAVVSLLMRFELEIYRMFHDDRTVSG